MRKSLFGLISGICSLVALVGCNRFGANSSTSSSSSGGDPATPPATGTTKNFAIYYSYPSSVNGTYTVPAAAAEFKKYDLVVFGTGLEVNTHPDYANMVAIAASMKGTTQIFGYVDAGNTDAYDLATFKTHVDDWADNINVDGIFLDEIGFDFRLSGATDADVRTRQKSFIDYVHSRGLKVFVNAFDPDDLFVKQPGTPLTWQAGDKYLYESYIFSSATRETFADYRTHVAKAQTAHAQTGIEIYATTTTSAATTSFVQSDYDYALLSAGADGFQGLGWGTSNYSASDSLLPFRSNPALASVYVVPQVVIDTGAGTIHLVLPGGTYQLSYSSPSFASL